jgi:hypothetical protein
MSNIGTLLADGDDNDVEEDARIEDVALISEKAPQRFRVCRGRIPTEARSRAEKARRSRARLCKVRDKAS